MPIESITKTPINNRKTVKKEADGGKKKDILQDTPVRYLGYSDDVGASISHICKVCNKGNNPLLAAFPKIMYVPAYLYAALDTFDKYKKGDDGTGEKPSIKAGIKQGVFQGLTSLLFPITTVKTAQKLGAKALDKFVPSLRQVGSTPNIKREVALMAFGIGALVALTKPIDKFTKEIIINKGLAPILDKFDKNKKQDKDIQSASLKSEDTKEENTSFFSDKDCESSKI